MSGIDTFNKIRKLDADIPIIAMTAFAMEHDEKKFIDLGFSSYISKPISIDKFLETISEICNNDNGESRGS
jgi:two-component system cell cycle response regulator DivK